MKTVANFAGGRYLREVVVHEVDQVVSIRNVFDQLSGGRVRLVQLTPLLCPQPKCLYTTFRTKRYAFFTISIV
jgi:hypothetical protein